MLPRGAVVSGSGPIYLSDLNCDGSETSLLDCRRRNNQPTGLQTCEHSHDVSIRCRGTYNYDILFRTTYSVCLVSLV